jgi:hypothetical protein
MFPEHTNNRIDDIDAYLQSAEVAAVFEKGSPANSQKRAAMPSPLPQQSSRPPKQPFEPRQLSISTASPVDVSRLSELCQAKGLPPPAYEIRDVTTKNGCMFTGSVAVGHERVAAMREQEVAGSKKEVKQVLAAMAMARVEGMPSSRTVSGEKDGENWVGKLMGMQLPPSPILTHHPCHQRSAHR